MATPLNTLLVEDSQDDADLLVRQLRRGGWSVIERRVDTAEAMADALASQSWDLIVADYSLPRFSGPAALDMARRHCPDVPLLLVSGATGEETAVQAMQAGADDYLFKGNLSRLCPAVERGLRRAAEQRAARDAEAELRKKQAQLTNDLIAAKDAAESANKAKDQFLAVLSHELRTPLTPILALVSQWLEDSGLSPEFRADLDVIQRNIETESRLIDDLLDMTRIVRDKLEMHFEVVDAHAALRQCLDTIRNRIVEHRLQISLDLGAARNRVWADPARLKQVFGNLLNNAVKFTGDGGNIQIRSSNNTDDRFVVEFSDDGIGIEPDVWPRLFKNFEQGEQTPTRRYGGLGLGLSIAKSLVEKQNGHITASSPGRNQGSTFTVELNTVAVMTAEGDAAQPGDATEGTPTAEPGAARRSRVLLVEDHDDTRRVMTRLLVALGFSVVGAASVKEALDIAESNAFDLLVSDIGLPDGTGIDVIRQLKLKHQFKAIAVSGFGQAEDLRRSQEAGFQTHLTKPIDFTVLKTTLQRLAV